MKKILILLFFISAKTFSQDLVPFTYGPLVSMTSTSLSSKPDFKDQVAGAGFNVGAMLRLKVLLFYAQGEVAFGTKSASISVIDTLANKDVKFNLQGMDLTAMLGMKLLGLGEIGNLRIFAGYNWNNYSDISYTVDGTKFAASNVNSHNNSILVGAGVDILKLSIDLKFIEGLTDLTSSDNDDVKTHVINLTVSYRLR